MKKHKIIYMPHAAHSCVTDSCKFRLATAINGKYIVSTVGDYYHPNNPNKQTIGCDRYYETMVFKAHKNKDGCGCKYAVSDFAEIDYLPANTAEEAVKNHDKLIKYWSKK